MSEPVVTIKFTKSEVILLNNMIGFHIADWEEKEQLPESKYLLQKQLLKIEEMINEKDTDAINNKRISKKSSERQTKMETKQRICVLCDN